MRNCKKKSSRTFVTVRIEDQSDETSHAPQAFKFLAIPHKAAKSSNSNSIMTTLRLQYYKTLSQRTTKELQYIAFINKSREVKVVDSQASRYSNELVYKVVSQVDF